MEKPLDIELHRALAILHRLQHKPLSTRQAAMRHLDSFLRDYGGADGQTGRTVDIHVADRYIVAHKKNDQYYVNRRAFKEALGLIKSGEAG